MRLLLRITRYTSADRREVIGLYTAFDLSRSSEEYCKKLDKLMSDFCYVVNRSTGKWYMATLCMDMLRKYDKSYVDLNGMGVSFEEVQTAIYDNMFVLLRLEQQDCLRMRSFFASVYKPSKRTSLKDSDVYTVTEMKYAFDKVLQILRTSPVEIDGTKYIEYCGGIATSGEILLRTETAEVRSIPLFSINNVRPCHVSDNINKLLNGVCKYKNKKVTLNREILCKYYGEGFLFSKLESKGVRYRYCYYDILINGGKNGLRYYKQRYGIEEDFKSITELLGILRNNMSSISDKCVARQLCSVSSLTGKGNKPSFYITIPEDAVLEEYVSDLSTYRVYFANSNYGYGELTCFAVDINGAKSKAKSKLDRLYGGKSVVLSIMSGGKLLEGKEPLIYINNKLLRDTAQTILYGYTEYFNDYADKIRALAELNGIRGVTDNHIKFLLVNPLAKKYRYSGDVEFQVFIKYLVIFFSYFTGGTAEKKLNDILRSLCLSRLKAEYKNLDASTIPDGGTYKCAYGIIYKKDGKLSKMVDLYYDDVFIGKSVISGVKENV